MQNFRVAKFVGRILKNTFFPVQFQPVSLRSVKHVQGIVFPSICSSNW